MIHPFKVMWFLFGLASPILAQDSLSVQNSDTTFSISPLAPMYNPVDMGPFLMKSILILAVLTVALYFGLKVYRRFAYSQGLNRNPYSVRILSSSMLGPKKSVHMLRALNHLLLVGVTDGQISVLLDVPFSELDEETKKSLESTATTGPAVFNGILQEWMKRKSDKGQ